jgi:hypothetical protein
MTLSLNTMDITDRKEKGKELHDHIVKEVKRLVNSNLFLPIPNVLLLTQKQYDGLSLLTNNPIENMFYSEDKLYKTPYNVMEIRVQGRTKLTFEEAMDLDDKTFDEWEKSMGNGDAETH